MEKNAPTPQGEKKMKQTWIALGLVTAIALAAQLLDPHEPHYPWDFVGFYVLFGLVGCIVLIVVAKTWGKLIERPTDYYGGDDRSM